MHAAHHIVHYTTQVNDPFWMAISLTFMVLGVVFGGLAIFGAGWKALVVAVLFTSAGWSCVFVPNAQHKVHKTRYEFVMKVEGQDVHVPAQILPDGKWWPITKENR